MIVLLLSFTGTVVGVGIALLVMRLARWPEAPPTPLGLLETTPQAPSHPGPTRTLHLHLGIPLTTAALFALAGARYDEPAHLALTTAYIAVLVGCASTDLMAHRVPNAITYPAIVGALAVGLAVPGARWVDVVTGGALAGAVFLVPALLTHGQGIGMGDVKLALFIGLALGLSLTPGALLVTALLGGLAAGPLVVFGLGHRRDAIPYAPFLAAGALAVLLLQGAAFGEAV